MQESDRSVANKSVNRRQFVTALGATVIASGIKTSASAQSSVEPREVFIVPNFHPASCGWLTTFSRERIYCGNSYLNQLDRVRDDPNYKFLLSEVNNLIAILNFKPERMPEFKRRVAEKRVELVNGYFLESTINLSGGEALVRLGVEGIRWYEKVMGTKPKYGWNIDTCGVHEQMPQITAGLGFEAMVYTRKNPAGKTIFWSASPDGSQILTLCPGHYAEATPIFTAEKPLDQHQLKDLETMFEKKAEITPDGAPILVLAGSGDYSLAPALQTYPTQLLKQWKDAKMPNPITFASLSDYLDPILPRIKSGAISIPTFKGGTDYSFDAFWIENYEVKTRYRSSEQKLQAAEMLSSLAHLSADYEYPVQDLNDSWILMCLNMDRNTLWGSAGGMVFVSEESWDVQDRLNWVDRTASGSLLNAAKAILPAGDGVGLFNQLNWKRNDPVALRLPAGTSLAGVEGELLPDKSVLCALEMLSASIGSWKLEHRAATSASRIDLPESIETRYYSVRINPHTGAITSIRFKESGRELLAGPANVIVAERPEKKEASPADFMPARPERVRLATSSDTPSSVQLWRGPLTYTIEVLGTFYGGGEIRRVIRLYHESPRIDFETELNAIPDYTVVVAEFPLAEEVPEIRRGIPYGFSHGAWSKPNPNLHGWTKGIVPTVRWIDYGLSGGGGIAVLDRGATGREINGSTPVIFLLNAEEKYHGYPNSWLSGEGKHLLQYALYPHEEPWNEARVPQIAWEYNCPPVLVGNYRVEKPRSILETSGSVIVEALRCETNHIELRMVEYLGKSGTASVRLMLPHKRAVLTDLTGRQRAELPKSETYNIDVKPQQIVTVHFETGTTLPEAEAVTKWDRFVPEQKLPALHNYDATLVGHPPFGNASNTF
ncbi:MAG TPA: glycoside hydrolase family 38 C-terminal domain-containing protein [Terracidiphilus sp.]|nr:glycoside hydrolase family 38 C-terminal domain-containing protein [Terracidiphilus sp.]